MMSLFKKAHIEITERQLSLFAVFYDMLVDHNDEYDLTRIRNFDDIIIKHFIDSVYFTRFVPLPSSVIDIGTGPGFPGIPLKIMNPGLKLILAEPKARRAAFLNMAVQGLELTDTEIYPHLVTDKSFFTVDGAITRALESVNSTLSRVKHFLPDGGHILFMKGPDAETDLDEVDEKNKKHFKLEADRKYTLPGTSYKRRIITFTKTGGGTTRTHRIFKNIDEAFGTPVTSPENKIFKELKKLTGPAGMKKTEKLLIAGKKIVTEFLSDNSIEKERVIIYDGFRESGDELAPYLQKFNAAGSLFILKRSLYNELDIFNTSGPLLTVKMPYIAEWNGNADKGCYLLVPFQDPQNVGSVIRSAAAFGVSGVILLKEAAFPFHPKAVRASSGAVFKIPLFRGDSIHGFMENAGKTPVVSLDKRGCDIASFTFPDTFYLLPGMEGPGLPDEAKNRAISIPLNENIDSLNGAAAAAIALYEWKRKK
jgi:16S rRNA (guanine527-N7)-methyltransferase